MWHDHDSPWRFRLPALGLAALTAAVAVLWAFNLGGYDYVKNRLQGRHPAVAATLAPTPSPTMATPILPLPSVKGLNYGAPHTAGGGWLGTRWLRPQNWASARVALDTDLAFIQQNDLGLVVRIFVGIDQVMIWDPNQGYVGFDPAGLDNFQDALTLLDAHGLKAFIVVYDQEDTSSPGNFRFQALDGEHDTMRRSYLVATDVFMKRFGAAPEVAGWDLLNEPYNSLGQDGHLPRPGTANPVSPNYSEPVVHQWMRDLYHAAKAAAPTALFTFSDTTELYWKDQPDVSKYEDSVDFYDMHIYDDHPRLRNWRGILQKPYLIGELGASTDSGHFDDQRINPGVVQFFLTQARATGLSAVLAHSDNENVFNARNGLTPTGQVVASFK